MMGPSARHIGRAELEERLSEAAEHLKARASIRVEALRKKQAVSVDDQTRHGLGRESWR